MTTVEQEAAIHTFQQSDGYVSHYRLWGSPEGADVIVLLHGGISHSAWQAPLAKTLVSGTNISFVALDRRGSGLNTEGRGHLLSAEREIDDVASFTQFLGSAFDRVHLAGWCFGGQVASIAAARLVGQDVISSLTMVAPGFVFNERYNDVLKLTMQSVFEVIAEFDLDPDPARAFVPVPLQSTDFTAQPDWLQFIDSDRLKLTKVTARTVSVWNDLADSSRKVLAKLTGFPVLAVFGRQDRLVDNNQVIQMLTKHVTHPAPHIEILDTHHAVQFEAAQQLAEIITKFVSRAP